MKVIRYDTIPDDWAMNEDPNGRFVSYDDYLWMSNYADRLVAHKDMVCLPKDLELLRESNLALSIENDSLKIMLQRANVKIALEETNLDLVAENKSLKAALREANITIMKLNVQLRQGGDDFSY